MNKNTLDIIAHPSSNFDDRPVDQKIKYIILHYTGMHSGQAALERLCEDKSPRVSAHYLVETDGRVFQMVGENKRAWHAGVSYWKKQKRLNDNSIGIEIVNPGHEWGYTDFSPMQIDALIVLMKGIIERHGIRKNAVIGHSDIAPQRKEDPGERFPWDRLAAEGLAIGTFQGGYDAAGENSLSYAEALDSLKDIGYELPDGGHAASVLAFQRRFCPAALGQGLSPLTKAAIEWAKRKMQS